MSVEDDAAWVEETAARLSTQPRGDLPAWTYLCWHFASHPGRDKAMAYLAGSGVSAHVAARVLARRAEAGVEGVAA